ncbi:MAG: hypothetical protein AB7H77_08295 [Bdellovibrionales bacterium]
MNKNGLLIFLGLLLVAGVIFVHSCTGRYSFHHIDPMSYAKYDTRNGDAWYCVAGMDECLPISDKAAFLAQGDLTEAVDKLRAAGFSEQEIQKDLAKIKRSVEEKKRN